MSAPEEPEVFRRIRANRESQLILTFSLTKEIWLNILSAAFFFAIAVYIFLTELYFAPIPILLIGYSVYETWVLWHKPLREARFYDNHIQISGWKLKLRANYDELENLSKPAPRKFLGEVISGDSVFFAIKGDPHDFQVPNRKFGRPKTELYQWLLTKNPGAAEWKPFKPMGRDIPAREKGDTDRLA